MSNEIRLPIKIVESTHKDLSKPDLPGGSRVVFGEVTQEVKDRCVAQLNSIGKYFDKSFKQQPMIPAVARVILKKKAIAKSHRPSALFTTSTCPILGVREFGELLISVTPSGLLDLNKRILTDTSKITEANVSTIQKIEPFTLEEAIGSELNNLKEEIKSKDNELRIRIFIHPSSQANYNILSAFQHLTKNLQLPEPNEVFYSKDMKVFKLTQVQPNHLEILANFVGTQNISTFPRFHFVKPACIPISKADIEQFSKPNPNVSYPVIGIIDTGTNPADSILSSWRINRHIYVPANQRDFKHASFIAGMAIFGRQLNRDERFPDHQVKFVDVAAMPDNGELSEPELLAIIEDVLPKHPEVKYWNLSLNSTAKLVNDNTFSYLAVALDRLQSQYNTTFVISAGNYIEMPRRSWPPINVGEKDRILPPADSVRGVTVGAIAHLDRPGTLVQREQPSPFSRRGPGAAFLPKPEISHYGGNCKDDLDHTQVGLRSFDGAGNIAEWIGTSFSTPIVTSVLANIKNSIKSDTSPCLIRALITHSAVLGYTDLSPQELRYKGFGIPGDLTSVLTCSPWEATLIFEPELREGYIYNKNPFPFPPCLFKEGKATGEVIMTLAYDPPLDAKAGAEYCRVNVSASLGTCEISSENKPIGHDVQIHPQPKNKELASLYESYQIENGFKWSPLKVYRRCMPKGVTGKAWNLRLTMLTRSDYLAVSSQKVALIVTIRDPNKNPEVYNETIKLMRNTGWVTQDLQVEERIKLQA